MHVYRIIESIRWEKITKIIMYSPKRREKSYYLCIEYTH